MREDNHLLRGRAESELRSIQLDVKVVVSDGYVLSKLIALRARIFWVVLVDEFDAEHAAASEEMNASEQRRGEGG